MERSETKSRSVSGEEIRPAKRISTRMSTSIEPTFSPFVTPRGVQVNETLIQERSNNNLELQTALKWSRVCAAQPPLAESQQSPCRNFIEPSKGFRRLKPRGAQQFAAGSDAAEGALLPTWQRRTMVQLVARSQALLGSLRDLTRHSNSL